MNMKKALLVGVIGSSALMITACGTNETKKVSIEDVNIITESHNAAESLAKGLGVNSSDSVIVTSFADINYLSQSSPLGRMLSQQVSSGLTNSGVKVIELLTREAVYVKQAQGEFVLSRDINRISQKASAPYAVAGTYALGKNTAYVTAKLIKVETSEVMASHDFKIPLGPDAKVLARNK